MERREGKVERVTRALHDSNDGDYDDDDEDIADDSNQTKIIPTEGNTDQVHVVEVN